MTSLTSLAAESEVQALRFALRFSPPTLVLEYKRGSDGKKRVSKFQLRKLKSSSVSDGGVGWDCLLFETTVLAASTTAQFLSYFFLAVLEHGLLWRPATVYECKRCKNSTACCAARCLHPHAYTIHARTHTHQRL